MRRQARRLPSMIKDISVEHITIIRAFQNGVPTRKKDAELFLKAQDILDIKLITSLNGQRTVTPTVINKPTPIKQPNFASSPTSATFEVTNGPVNGIGSLIDSHASMTKQILNMKETHGHRKEDYLSKITQHQKKVLIDFMKTNYNVLEGKFKSGQGNSNKESLWAELCLELNACGPPKSTPQWQKCWTDLKGGVRKKFRQLTAQCQKTGGGVVDPKFELDKDQNDIFEICGVDYFAGDNITNEIGFQNETVRVQSEQSSVYPLIIHSPSPPLATENPTQTPPFSSKKHKIDNKENEHVPKKRPKADTATNVVEMAMNEAKKTNELLEKMINLLEKTNESIQKLIDAVSPTYIL